MLLSFFLVIPFQDCGVNYIIESWLFSCINLSYLNMTNSTPLYKWSYKEMLTVHCTAVGRWSGSGVSKYNAESPTQNRRKRFNSQVRRNTLPIWVWLINLCSMWTLQDCGLNDDALTVLGKRIWRMKKVQMTGCNFSYKGLTELTRKMTDQEKTILVDVIVIWPTKPFS